MGIINKLDKKIYNRISAGEVVERPASVVKELIENSIDALATQIEINIFDGGKSLIEIRDNGSGMYKDDLAISILPHATSKIKEVSDLDSIATLGFRGEALASIASISTITIASKRKGESEGYSLTSEGGENVEIKEDPIEKGTLIKVANLFYNTPARLKFLKSDKYEENEITDLIARMILANPTISFKYSANNKVLLQSYGDGVEDSLISVYGIDYINNSFKISKYRDGISIEGYIGKHNFTKSNHSYETAILNGRIIDNKTISSAVYNAYLPYLMKRKYPFYVLYISMPTELVDVNVTPNKSDVRFVDNSVVYGCIYSTVSKVLDGTDKAPTIVVEEKKEVNKTQLVSEEIKEEKEKSIHSKDINLSYPSFTPSKSNIESVRESLIKEKEEKKEEEKTIDIFQENKRYILEQEKKKEKFEYASDELKKEAPLVYKCQVLDTYLIFEKGEDIFFIDQHAAHERVLFNRLLDLRTKADKDIQPLLIPYTISPNPFEYEKLKSKLNYLREFGIEIDEDQRGDFNVTAIPLELMDIKLSQFFDDILSDSLIDSELPTVIMEKLAQKACKAAIKAGKIMSKDEVDSLIKLLNGNMDLKCPHGRPIAVKIESREIEKWFKRIV